MNDNKKQMTMKDVVDAIIRIAVGGIIIIVIGNTPTFPHNGFVALAGLGFALWGGIGFIYKYFKTMNVKDLASQQDNDQTTDTQNGSTKT